jgi:hypothetical protein
MKIKTLPFLTIILLLLSLGCKKDLAQLDSTTKTSSLKTTSTPPYIIDWETSDYMPSTPANAIPMPWSSGTTAINPDIVGDYKKADGWVLVYNTFTPTTPLSNNPVPYIFALYNQYRGLLRFYIWQPPTTVFSSYLSHGLNINSTGSINSMLNFEVNDITDVTVNQSAFSKIDNQQISTNGGTWFALQYEIAYDPTIATTSFPNVNLGLTAKYVNISIINLSGTQTGTLEGTISTPASSFSLTGVLTTVAKSAIEAYGTSKLSSLLDTSKTAISLKSAVQNALSGNVKGFLNAIIGGSSGGSSQKVKLTMNTQLQLAGTEVNTGLLLGIQLAFPGQSNSQTASVAVPVYDNVMGVFNLTSKPIITRSSKVISGRTVFTVKVDQTSIHEIFNPVVTSIADIVPVSTDVVLVKANFNLKPAANETTNASTETIGELTAYTASSAISVNKAGTDTDIFTPNAAVRITFDVVPKNGAPKTRIVKTFLATIAVQ